MFFLLHNKMRFQIPDKTAISLDDATQYLLNLQKAQCWKGMMKAS